MTAIEVNLAKSTSKARLKCPSGHISWRPHTKSGFNCQACNQSYDKLIDTRTGERIGQDEIRLIRERR